MMEDRRRRNGKQCCYNGVGGGDEIEGGLVVLVEESRWVSVGVTGAVEG